jgi:hypothetical protein
LKALNDDELQTVVVGFGSLVLVTAVVVARRRCFIYDFLYWKLASGFLSGGWIATARSGWLLHMPFPFP